MKEKETESQNQRKRFNKGSRAQSDMGTPAKECVGNFWKLGKTWRQIFPQRFQKECSPYDTLILA